MPALPLARRTALEELAASAGIKLSYNKFRSYHTHLVEKAFKPSGTVLQAAMHGRPITMLAWLDRFLALTALPDAPEDFPPPRKDDEKTDVAYESRLAALFSDVGADYHKFFRHAKLEDDWELAPAPEGFLELSSEWARSYTAVGWALPNPARSKVFQDVVVVSLRGSAVRVRAITGLQEEADQIMQDAEEAELVKLGGGHFVAKALPVKATREQINAIVDAVWAGIKRPSGITEANVAAGAYSVVLLAPPGVSSDPTNLDGDGSAAVTLDTEPLSMLMAEIALECVDTNELVC